MDHYRSVGPMPSLLVPSSNESHVLHNLEWKNRHASSDLKNTITDVLPGSVGESGAREFADFFRAHSSCTDRYGLVFSVANMRLRGFSKAYPTIHSKWSDMKALLRAQQKVTIVVRDEYTVRILVDRARGFNSILEGARELAAKCASFDPELYELKLVSFHIILQESNLCLSSSTTGDTHSTDSTDRMVLSGEESSPFHVGGVTTFGVHQDTEEDSKDSTNPRHVSVVVRLSDQGSTHMYVEGASALFKYGSQIGDAGAFLSHAYHRSIPSDTTQTKIAFFFSKNPLSMRDRRKRRRI